ncbi:MAG: ribonuclease [Lachnospiraceae bacterium]|nr:ribonuclease [Lachnospiraceae bacterium]
MKRSGTQLILTIIAVLLLTACGGQASGSAGADETVGEEDAGEASSADEDDASYEVDWTVPEPEENTSTPEAMVAAGTEEQSLDENGTYDSKDQVALYIHEFGHLPTNYITKETAKQLGWDGGSIEKYAPGYCIGGDYFGNYEGTLPEDANYFECDIDTLGKNSRGSKRLVYSDTGEIYYTEDHYETFEQLY